MATERSGTTQKSPSLAVRRSRIVTLARKWAEKGGVNWSDDQWERELAKLRKAVADYDEALNA